MAASNEKRREDVGRVALTVSCILLTTACEEDFLACG